MEWLLFDRLQDAYEETVVAAGGVWNLPSTVKEFVKALFYQSVEAKCLRVDPSVVGEVRDTERRQPSQNSQSLDVMLYLYVYP